MHLVPIHERGGPVKHLRLTAATAGSVANLAAPGTGLVWVPIYGWANASGAGSVRYMNGSGGSTLFTLKLSAGGVSEFAFWEQPSTLLSNQVGTLEGETAGIGVHDVHVWCMAVRAGAGQSGTGQ